MTSNTNPIFPSIEHESRSHVDTACAAYWLNRQPQTMRTWACLENGPIRPKRINGRLAWEVVDIKRILAEGATTIPKPKGHSLRSVSQIMKRPATSASYAILEKALSDEIGANDPYPTTEQLTQYRKKQLNDGMSLPSNMQHLHILSDAEFAVLKESANIVHSFELGSAITLHSGVYSHKPIWLIDSGCGKSGAALYVADSLRAHFTMQQPFEAENFYAVDMEVALQTLKESEITDSCDLGSGITIQCGTRGKNTVWVMQNADTAGMCAVWFDDGMC